MSINYPDTENMICLLDFGKSSRTQVPDQSGNGNHGSLSGFQNTGEEFDTDSQYGQIIKFANSVNTKVEISAIEKDYKTFLFLIQVDKKYAGLVISVILGIGDALNFLGFGDGNAPYTMFGYGYYDSGSGTKRIAFEHDRPIGFTPCIFRFNSTTKDYSFFIDGQKIPDAYSGTYEKQVWNNKILDLGYRIGAPSVSFLGDMKLFGLWKSELSDEQCLNLINDLSAWSPKAELLSNDGSNWYLNSKFQSGLIDYDLNGGNHKCFINENTKLEFTNTCWLWNKYGKTFTEGVVKLKARKKSESSDQLAFYFQTDNKINNTGSINGYAIVLDDANDKIEIWKNGTAILSEDFTVGTEWHEIELTKSGINFALTADGVSIGNVNDSDYTGKGHECWYCVAGNWEVESYEIKYS